MSADDHQLARREMIREVADEHRDSLDMLAPHDGPEPRRVTATPDVVIGPDERTTGDANWRFDRFYRQRWTKEEATEEDRAWRGLGNLRTPESEPFTEIKTEITFERVRKQLAREDGTRGAEEREREIRDAAQADPSFRREIGRRIERIADETLRRTLLEEFHREA